MAQPFHHGFAFHLNQADPSKPLCRGSTPLGSVQEPQHEQKPKEHGEGWAGRRRWHPEGKKINDRFGLPAEKCGSEQKIP